MHISLSPKLNIILIVTCSAIVAFGFAAPAVPSRIAIVAIGAVFGLYIGMQQVRAIDSNRELFLTADSASAVRKAMKSTSYGRKSIYALWLASAVLLAVAVWQRDGLFIRLIVGYSALALVRESVSLRSCFGLQVAARAKRKA